VSSRGGEEEEERRRSDGKRESRKQWKRLVVWSVWNLKWNYKWIIFRFVASYSYMRRTRRKRTEEEEIGFSFGSSECID